MLFRSNLQRSITVRESSTPAREVSRENQWRTSPETGQSLDARSSNCAQFGSNSPAKRIAFKFSCDFALMRANDKTERCGRPRVSELTADGARPHSLH